MSLRFPWRAAALALVAIAGSLTAHAADQAQPLTLSGGASLPEAATAPTFHFDFLLDDPVRQALRPPGSSSNLEIALTSPNNGVFHFLFSPRPQFGFANDGAAGISRSYAGLSWNLFDSSGLYGNLGLTDAYRAFHRETHRYTFWDYQAGRWNRDEGLRIDHLLLSPEAADRLKDAGIDKAPRSWERASDHTPVWCEIGAARRLD